MDHRVFLAKQKQHCIEQNAQCEQCCLRLYCFTPPVVRTDYMVDVVTDFLTENIHKESHDQSDRYSEMFSNRCPGTLDMTNALGYEHH